MTTCQYKDIAITTTLDGIVTAEQTAEHLIRIRAEWQPHTQKQPMLNMTWAMPLTDVQYEWYPACGMNRGLRVDWQSPVVSRISSSAPVFCFYNAKCRSRMTIALSDALTEISCSFGVHEEDGTLLCRVSIPLDPSARTNSYEVSLYRSDEDVSFAEAVRRVARWWETDCGYTPIPVPDDARMPLYSCWYSYHQATIADKIIAECALAAQLGMKTVIVDDGWQTSDGQRGYGYCGDWEPCTEKIPNMKQLVDAVHALGMKFMLWYSVPFLGYHAKHWNTFKDMLLERQDNHSAGTLDPRYHEVRDFMIGKYRSAMLDWGLDGFKLDFIDSFLPTSKAPPANDRMDYARVEDAVLRLMTDVRAALTAINPDVMIEFRQSYIGPAMRTYGNMFRVADCPDDLTHNRVGIADLRLTSGDTAVHSDMLMWHADDTVEAAARQLLSVLFGVPQLSMRIAELPEEHRRMVAYWLRFMTEHRELLSAPIEVEEPHMLYPLVRTALADEEAIALYGSNRAVRLSAVRTAYLVNASAGETVYIEMDKDVPCTVELINCMGEPVCTRQLQASAFHRLTIPVCGMAIIRR